MSKLTLTFKSNDDRERFLTWYLDEGGEGSFQDTQFTHEYDTIIYVTGWGKDYLAFNSGPSDE